MNLTIGRKVKVIQARLEAFMHTLEIILARVRYAGYISRPPVIQVMQVLSDVPTTANWVALSGSLSFWGMSLTQVKI